MYDRVRKVRRFITIYRLSVVLCTFFGLSSLSGTFGDYMVIFGSKDEDETWFASSFFPKTILEEIKNAEIRFSVAEGGKSKTDRNPPPSESLPGYAMI